MSIANATVLVTGAGGSVGSVLVKELLKRNASKVQAFDIDEYSLVKLDTEIRNSGLSGMETFLGDVKDASDVERAVRGCSTIVHLAAVKMVDISSYHPIPCIRTNIDGTVNVLSEALKQPSVDKLLFVSSDKAVDFASAYGATKFLGERLTLWANSLRRAKISACRFGNVIESRGNVFEIWGEQKEKGQPLTVTHEKMERYFWHVGEAVSFILKTLEIMKGGEIFIPKMKLFNVIDLAREVSRQVRLIGARPEEVLKAKLYADYEEGLLEDLGDMWVIRH